MLKGCVIDHSPQGKLDPRNGKKEQGKEGIDSDFQDLPYLRKFFNFLNETPLKLTLINLLSLVKRLLNCIA